MLKDNHEAFCQSYVICWNATTAAKEAGYAKDTAYSQGHRLLQRMDIQIRIEQLKHEANEQFAVTRERVITELGRLAFSDIRKVFGDGRSLKDVTDLDDHTAAAVESIKVVANKERGEVVDHTHEIKLANKGAALDKLAKHFNIYEDHQKSGAGEMHVTIEGKDVGL